MRNVKISGKKIGDGLARTEVGDRSPCSCTECILHPAVLPRKQSPKPCSLEWDPQGADLPQKWSPRAFPSHIQATPSPPPPGWGSFKLKKEKHGVQLTPRGSPSPLNNDLLKSPLVQKEAVRPQNIGTATSAPCNMRHATVWGRAGQPPCLILAGGGGQKCHFAKENRGYKKITEAKLGGATPVTLHIGHRFGHIHGKYIWSVHAS